MVERRVRNLLADDLDRVLTESPGLWDDLRGARLFVTGASGFFGSWLLETLLWANDRLQLGARVVALTRDGRAFLHKAPHLARHPAVTLHEGNVLNCAFPAGSFSHVIHAAADPSPLVDRGDRERMFATIVDGTRRALEFARRAQARRFLFTSSGAVYGRQPAGMTHIPEDYAGAPDPADPGQAYGEAKRAAEAACAIHAGGDLEPTIARCFAFIGPHFSSRTHAAPQFIGDALLGGPIRVGGDGTPVRSYLYGSDLAVWLWTILLRAPVLRPYNVGSPGAVTIRELAEAVARAAGEVGVQVALSPVAGAPPHRYVPSTERAEQELGLRAFVPLDEAIRKTLTWQRAGVSA